MPVKEYQYESEIKCPYCDHEFSDSYEYSEESGEIGCHSCDKTFSLSVDVEITYSTRVIDCKDGEHVWDVECRSYDYDQAWIDNRRVHPVLGDLYRGKKPHTLWHRDCTICSCGDSESVEFGGENPWLISQ